MPTFSESGTRLVEFASHSPSPRYSAGWTEALRTEPLRTCNCMIELWTTLATASPGRPYGRFVGPCGQRLATCQMAQHDSLRRVATKGDDELH
jgi:hypothetical protein